MDVFLIDFNMVALQDDTAFEKQSALFALAVSDIVLINMYVLLLSIRRCLSWMSIFFY